MKNNIYSSILSFIMGVMLTYNIMYQRPPNMPLKRFKISHKPLVNKVDTSYIVTHVTMTCYNPIKSQCDNDPLTTADGSKINLKNLKRDKIRWCAISQDLLYLFPKNKPKRIWIEGYGVYEVRDVMNKRFKHKVDLLIHPKNSLRVNKDNVKIKIFK